MAPIEVIDLVSSDDELFLTPRKAASTALQTFEPRKQRTSFGAGVGSVHGLDGAESGVRLQPVSTSKKPSLSARESDAPALISTHRASISTGKRRVSEQDQDLPSQIQRKPLARPIPVTQTGAQSFADHSPDLGTLARIEHYEAFHAKENWRYGKQANSRTPSCATSEDRRVFVDKEPSSNERAERREHNALASAKPVLQGNTLSIFDIPPDAADVPSSRKRPALLHLPSEVPPLKRIHLDAQISAVDQDSLHDRDKSARLSALQLGQELDTAVERAASSRDSAHENVASSIGAPVHQPNLRTDAPSALQLAPTSGAGVRYTEEDNVLISKLRDKEGLSWDQIMRHFPGRSKGSLNVHYSTKVKGRYGVGAKQNAAPQRGAQQSHQNVGPAKVRSEEKGPPQAALPRRRGGGASVLDGFVSWSQVGNRIPGKHDTSATDASKDRSASDGTPLLARQDRAFPSKTPRILRQRELGICGSRGWASSTRRTSDELKNAIIQDYTPTRHYMSTSGDVTCLAWAANGQRFAAGSIAITDDRSMQYNANLNLMVGDSVKAILQELPEHHVSRPIIENAANVNALHAMRQSQDSRLFMTVAETGFSPDGARLYTAGSDKMLRAYAVRDDVTKTRCLYDIEHPTAVDLLSINGRQGLVAAGVHTNVDGSIRVYDCGDTSWHNLHTFSPSRTDSPSSLPIFPSALKWGLTPQQSRYLLAGFSSDSNDEERDTAGETALWNVETGQRWNLSTVTRNVFDVAWNPSPSSASTAFCVASTPGHGKSSPGRRSVVQCYAPEQGRARQVLEWECAAFDINDVLYCPCDDNLIAAGATDGKIYIWDKRFASQNQGTLHTLGHGESINVLDHDRDIERADTGVRFLSWGATSSRLYSGSSDGVVKVWNPYRSPKDAWVGDAATFQAAIMSGSFSPDHHQLLIGEERGRLNLLSTGQGTEDTPPLASRAFSLNAVEVKNITEPPFVAAIDMIEKRQIEIRDMGTLPIRQAVQGPAYNGPFFLPGASDWNKVQVDYQQALDRQNKVCSPRHDSANEDQAERDADRAVDQARDAMDALQTRQDSHQELDVAAKATQRAFYRASKRRVTQEDDWCKLDCNYLPQEVDGEAPDSHRSEQRIPEAFRSFPGRPVDITELDCNGLYTAGLSAQCASCAGKLGTVFCRQRCNNIRAQLNSVCQSCGGPVRKQENAVPFCERCSVGCFRCSRPAQLIASGSPPDLSICCKSCALTWEVDVLGYNLVKNSAKNGRANIASRGIARREGGDTELHHYHSRWANESGSLVAVCKQTNGCDS